MRLMMSVCIATIAAAHTPIASYACPLPPSRTTSITALDAADAAPSKFVALMAGEDRSTAWAVEPIASQPVEWRSHVKPIDGYGRAQLTATVIDPSTVASELASNTARREMHLVKGLLSKQETDDLRVMFDQLCTQCDTAATSAGASTHTRVLIEDGRVVCQAMCRQLTPALEGRVLPYVRARLGEQGVVVADALVRAYRQEDRRQALAPHYDISSFATVILPLNGGEYEGGLYIQAGADAASRRLVDRDLASGDALLHSFDVMHGVEVSAGDRFSLVLWLSDSSASVQAQAAPWLLAAADAGRPHAQFLYAEACRAGRYGIEPNAARALAYGQAAARQGHALAQHQLGWEYWRRGKGGGQDAVHCRELWCAAAEAGLAAAQVDLANCYANGWLGCGCGEEAREEARRWYGRAARQGHREAAAMVREFEPPGGA